MKDKNQQAKIILPDGRGELINPFSKSQSLNGLRMYSDEINWEQWMKDHPDRIIEIKGQRFIKPHKEGYTGGWFYPVGSIVNVREIEKPKEPKGIYNNFVKFEADLKEYNDNPKWEVI